MQMDPLQTCLTSWIENEKSPCFLAAVLQNNHVGCSLALADRSSPHYADFGKETRLNIGSVTKTVTGALMTRLMADGALLFSHTVKTYLPEFPFADTTISELLHHTSGIDAFCCSFDRPQCGETDAFLNKLCASLKRTYAPGTESRYFSYGYFFLMVILERVSGMSFEDYAQKQLFIPLGKTHSTFDIRKLSAENTIMPYHRESDTFENLWNTAPTGDSGLYTTADDLLKFAAELQNAVHGRPSLVFSKWETDFLFRESTKGAFSRTPAFWMKGEHDPYGCFSPFASPAAVGHTGYTGCVLSMDPVYDLSCVVLSNSCALHEDWNNYRMLQNALLHMACGH